MASHHETPGNSPVWWRAPADELVNAATHALGFLLAVTGALVMSDCVLAHQDAACIVGCSAYLTSLIGVYAMSTLSHSVRTLKWKVRFRQLDQGTIFLLIAATYTPLSIRYLSYGHWWLLLAAVWVVAIGGFVSKVFFAHRVDLVSVAPYVLLGWLPILAAPTLVQVMPMAVFWWAVAGGVCYTIGTLFLVYDTHVRHFHAVWHLCVIAGSACHFCGILLAYVGGRA